MTGSDNPTATHTSTLEYCRVLLAGEQRLRSGKVAMTCIGMIVFAAVFGSVATGWIGPGSPANFRHCFGAGAIFAGGVAAFLLLNILIDRRIPFEISTAGIRNGNQRTVPWSRIARFAAGGKPTDATVRIFYGVGRPGLYIIHELQPISPGEYEALVARLMVEVLPSHPHLQLGGYAPARTLS